MCLCVSSLKICCSCVMHLADCMKEEKKNLCREHIIIFSTWDPLPFLISVCFVVKAFVECYIIWSWKSLKNSRKNARKKNEVKRPLKKYWLKQSNFQFQITTQTCYYYQSVKTNPKTRLGLRDYKVWYRKVSHQDKSDIISMIMITTSSSLYKPFEWHRINKRS